MRTRLFTAAFIVIQGFMVLFMMMGFASDDPSETSGPFWFLIGATFLVVMPLRGFGALSSEIRLNTMDLIAMTRMSAWRIIVGKWAALMSQAVLLTIAILPYVVLRYFHGSINLFGELAFLGVTLILSCLLSAIIVALSAFPNFLVRAILAVVACVGAGFIVMEMVDETTSGNSSIPYGHIAGYEWGYLAVIGMTLFLIYFFLEMGATRIAPESANHTTRRRVISLAVLLAVLSLPLVFPAVPAFTTYAAGTILVALFAIDALTESPSTVRSLHLPFHRMGISGRLMQIIFAPGWYSGAFYVLLLCGMLGCAENITDAMPQTSTFESAIIHASYAGTLLFPLLILHLFSPNQKALFAPYIFIQIGTGAVTACIFAISTLAKTSGVLWAACPLPMVGLAMAHGNYPHTTPLLSIACATLAITIAVCFFHARPMLAELRQLRLDHQSSTRAEANS